MKATPRALDLALVISEVVWCGGDRGVLGRYDHGIFFIFSSIKSESKTHLFIPSPQVPYFLRLMGFAIRGSSLAPSILYSLSVSKV